ncbi:MAG TPA: hypothetical protein VEW71_00450 [Allosphingosinicella sp.]|nr:hypothetical protein [Allosphingosinicella sp.]
MPVAVLLMATLAAGQGPLDGRLPARAQVQEAFAASRACTQTHLTECQLMRTETRRERCRRISVRRDAEGPAAATVAGARCRFQYSERIDAAHSIVVTRWTGTHADFFLIGLPCGGEGQEADMICYSWMTPRGEN